MGRDLEFEESDAGAENYNVDADDDRLAGSTLVSCIPIFFVVCFLCLIYGRTFGLSRRRRTTARGVEREECVNVHASVEELRYASQNHYHAHNKVDNSAGTRVVLAQTSHSVNQSIDGEHYDAIVCAIGVMWQLIAPGTTYKESEKSIFLVSILYSLCFLV